MSDEALRTHASSLLDGMRQSRLSWWLHWRELADFILPRRYQWLVMQNRTNRGSPINYNIVDSTGTIAARVLASGMMAGVTSPTRPWFKLRIEGYEEDEAICLWLAECEKRLMRVFQESNFYTAMATHYFDLVVFGTGVIIIYEDYENVIHCFNPCLGEYFLGLNDKFEVNTVGREFTMTFSQMISQFGKDKVSEDVRLSADTKYPSAAAMSAQERVINHVIEPNKGFGVVPDKFAWREVYWDRGDRTDRILSARGFHDWPCLTSRWDITSNDPYGRSPGMDALGDIKQLQQETRRKAQAIDKMVNPPLIVDIQLKNNPMSLLPGGQTYVAGLGSDRVGAKPLYTVMPPIAEMKQDIAEVQQRIRLIFNNDLFTGITDLQTVRTATEIDARREEKLVLLGPVLERIITELNKAIDRVWGIMWRGQLLPPPPAAMQGQTMHIQIDYVSMLAMAQKGLATAGIEKLWAFAGTLAGVVPTIMDNLDGDETIREYADALGTSPKIITGVEKRDAIRKARSDQQTAAAAMQTGTALAQGAKTLSDAEVGGGRNALQEMLGTENV